MGEDEKPATIGDLKETEGRLRQELQTAKQEIVDQLTEVMRTMQTELLRGFASIHHSQELRLRKVERNQTDLDTTLSGRVQGLEERLWQIEKRLGLP